MEENEYICATDISKFVYCKLQWEYRNINIQNEEESFDLKEKSYKNKSSFEKGREFHDKYLERYEINIIIKIILLVILAIIMILALGILIWKM